MFIQIEIGADVFYVRLCRADVFKPKGRQNTLVQNFRDNVYLLRVQNGGVVANPEGLFKFFPKRPDPQFVEIKRTSITFIFLPLGNSIGGIHTSDLQGKHIPIDFLGDHLRLRKT